MPPNQALYLSQRVGNITEYGWIYNALRKMELPTGPPFQSKVTLVRAAACYVKIASRRRGLVDEDGATTLITEFEWIWLQTMMYGKLSKPSKTNTQHASPHPYRLLWQSHLSFSCVIFPWGHSLHPPLSLRQVVLRCLLSWTPLPMLSDARVLNFYILLAWTGSCSLDNSSSISPVNTVWSSQLANLTHFPSSSW